MELNENKSFQVIAFLFFTFVCTYAGFRIFVLSGYLPGHKD